MRTSESAGATVFFAAIGRALVRCVDRGEVVHIENEERRGERWRVCIDDRAVIEDEELLGALFRAANEVEAEDGG